MTVWFDVDDLYFFAARSARPTGIQRLAGEVYKALARDNVGDVGFVRHAEPPVEFSVVPWESVRQLYDALATGLPTPSSEGDPPPQPSADGMVARASAAVRGLLRRPIQQERGRPAAQAMDLRRACGPGDFLMSLGAPWHDESYADRVGALIGAKHLGFGMLVHDLIPLLHPEFFETGRAPHFEKFMREALPMADVILTNSHATARDVVRWTTDHKLSLRTVPASIPIGTGFERGAPGALHDGLRPQEFVLFVSTIEVRKNHAQAFRVWLRLLESLPVEKVPKLVFAGSRGWMVDDLFKAVESTDHLGGKLMVLSGLDDRVLSALYRDCLFTLFLSHREGWGLPVSDSLAFGKVCVCSEVSSIPEAGGQFCIYVDPDNTTGTYHTIRQLIEAPDVLAAREQWLRRTFEPVPWSATARAVLSHAGVTACVTRPLIVTSTSHRASENAKASELPG